MLRHLLQLHGNTCTQMNRSEIKKNWILLASHRPEKDPRIGWIRENAPEDISIHCLAVDYEAREIRIEQDDYGMQVTFPYELGVKDDSWVSELYINKRDSLAAQIYLWLGHFTKPNRRATLSVFERHTSEKRGWRLFYDLLNIRELTYRLVGPAISLGPVSGIIAADFNTLLAAAIIKEILKVPVIYDAHEYRSEEDHHASEWEKSIFKDIERRLLRYTDARFIVSSGLSQLATIEMGHEFKTLPNAIPLVKKSPDQSEKVDKFHKFIFLGGMGEGRGLEKLIENWVYTDSSCHLYLQGPDSEFKENLKQLAQETGLLQNRVFFPNSASEKELMDALNGYEVGIIPYEPVCINNKFCCPNKLSQYMAGGLAILANETDYVKSILSQYKCGIAVDFNNRSSFLDAVRLLNTKPQLQEMRRNARDSHVSNYNWQKVSEEFYKSVQNIGKIEYNDLKNKIKLLFNSEQTISLVDLKKNISFSEQLVAYCLSVLIRFYRCVVPKKIHDFAWRLTSPRIS